MFHTCPYTPLARTDALPRYGSVSPALSDISAAKVRGTLMRKSRRKELARRLLNRGNGHLARERRLNGEENNPRTPHARPDPRQRVAAAPLCGVARSHDRIAATGA